MHQITTPTPAAAPFNPHEHPLYTQEVLVGDYACRPIDWIRHTLIFGSTGTGKTRKFTIPAAEALLRHFGSEPEHKAGACIIDAKADMSAFITETARKTGRLADVRLLGEGGNCWFDLFAKFEGRTEEVAAFLFDAVAQDNPSRGENDVFWAQVARALLHASVILARATHGAHFGGLAGIRNACQLLTDLNPEQSMGDDDEAPKPNGIAWEAILQRLEEGLIANRIDGRTARGLVDYCRKDILQNAPRTWGITANYARGVLDYFADEKLTSLFEPGEGKERVVPERIIDEGLILVVALSPLLYQGMEVPFLQAIKQSMCERILMRNELRNLRCKPARLINQQRPILLVMDEFHTTLMAGGRSNEAFFLDRAREFRCICLLACQGLSAIHSRMRDSGLVNHLLNNACTKVFFRTSCPSTLTYFESLVSMRSIPSQSEQMERMAAPPRFRLPNHQFVPHEQWRLVSRATSMRREPEIDAQTLRTLPDGVAIVVDGTGHARRINFSKAA